MRLIKSAFWAGLAASLVTAAGAMPAWGAGTPPLPWRSPPKVTSGVPFQMASIKPCPPLPTPGDQLLVGISITFPGGGLGNVLNANPDGSWSGDLSFTFSNTPRQARISADCQDYNGVSATTYAPYQTHHIQLFS
jgi:hypothetical protein